MIRILNSSKSASYTKKAYKTEYMSFYVWDQMIFYYYKSSYHM
jgi:hypothetical protein